MDDLGLDGQVLNSLPNSLNGFVLDDGLLNLLGDVLNLCLHCIVICDSPLDGDSFGVDNFFILNNFLFIGNLFDSFDSVILDILLLEGDVLDPAFDGYLLCDYSLASELDT